MIVIALAIGLATTLLTTRLFTATVRLQIDKSAAKIVENGNVAPTESGDFEFLRTQYELCCRAAAWPSGRRRSRTSPTIPTSPARSSRRSGRACSAWSGLEGPPTAPTRAKIERAATARVLQGVSSGRCRDRASSTCPTPTPSPPARGRSSWASRRGFIASNQDKRLQANAYAKSFLEDQVQQLQAKLQESEKVLLDFGQKEQIIAVTEKGSIAEGNLAAANAALGSLISERIRNEQQFRQVERVTAATLPQFLTNKVIEGLRDQKNTLVTSYQERLQTLKPSYPRCCRSRAR